MFLLLTDQLYLASNCIQRVGLDDAVATVLEKKQAQAYHLAVAGERDLVWYTCGLQVEAWNLSTSRSEHSFTAFDFEKRVREFIPLESAFNVLEDYLSASDR